MFSKVAGENIRCKVLGTGKASPLLRWFSIITQLIYRIKSFKSLNIGAIQETVKRNNWLPAHDISVKIAWCLDHSGLNQWSMRNKFVDMDQVSQTEILGLSTTGFNDNI